ncbi:MAG: 5'-methylthioadenosine/S-adenosylhomocysteine nucleosidase [Defluviitaleaceae bacterium]|nr:5'-methylthioadenosine/S-adenosylhomocysteine nucleosidase [Defluviitaleaceae bacterium]
MTDARKIAVQGAVEYEINYYISQLTNLKKRIVGGYAFYEGDNCGKNFVISQTGAGITHAAIATAICIHNYNPYVIINQGIAGAHRKDLNVGDIIIGKDAVNINSFISEGRAEGEGSDILKWKLAKRLQRYNADSSLIDFFVKHLPEGRQDTLGSGDMFNNEIDCIKWITDNLGTACEDMESAAVYQCCAGYDVPCIGIRIISNNGLIGSEYDRSMADKLQRKLLPVLQTWANLKKDVLK